MMTFEALMLGLLAWTVFLAAAGATFLLVVITYQFWKGGL